MCTLSWLAEPGGYQLWFNRDEQRRRARAEQPRYHSATGALYPIDPEGGGTWIALNDEGISFCLLNHYQADQRLPVGEPPGGWLSRGQLIPQLLAHTDLEFVAALQALSLTRFRPFVCCAFYPSDMHSSGAPQMALWDGQALTLGQPRSPLISSSVAMDAVVRHRRRLYSRSADTGAGRMAFHCSHQPSPSALSVCMHREDAATQSLSHIRVADTGVRFDYYDGAPCEVRPRTFTLPDTARNPAPYSA